MKRERGFFMNLVRITPENLTKEHICCAISNNRDIQVASKKRWLSDRLDEGLVFLKGDVRGKCFIEYIPAEFAWAPITANGFMYIDCFWVSGSLKGQGNGSLLLEECIRDSKEKGKRGLVVLSSKKKQGFLSDPDYLKAKGFRVADSAEPYFELLWLPFNEYAERPRFNDSARSSVHGGMAAGFTLYYTNQCPYTAKYVPILEGIAAESGVPMRVIKIDTLEKAKNAPSAFTTFALFHNGEFVTHEILSEKKFLKVIEEIKEK